MIHIVHGRKDSVVNHVAGHVIDSYYGHFVDDISQVCPLQYLHLP